jgi:hypothetical protein
MLYRITRHTALTSAHRPRLIESTHTTTILTRRAIPIVLYLQRPDAEAFRLASILLGIYIGVILRCIVYLKEIFYGY